ncbi:uncharacterized protein YbjT (DUF2867 family) [Oxalobacteraceae bacterium GrIS 1.11]
MSAYHCRNGGMWHGAGIPASTRRYGSAWRASLAFFHAWLMAWPRISVYDGRCCEWRRDPAYGRQQLNEATPPPGAHLMIKTFPPTGLRLLLLGASGAVGQAVLRQALADARIALVIAPTRRPLPPAPGLDNPVIDFAALAPEAPWWQVEAVICALGTTIKVAGSRPAFAAIDRDLVLQTARLARQAGATRMALNSSLGARVDGNFYQRVKAQAEQGVRELSYPVYTIVRPSLIDATRAEPRPAEYIGVLATRLLRPLLPKRYRSVKAAAIAHALLEGVLTDEAGEQIVESEWLQD